jgi:hypothetical protein
MATTYFDKWNEWNILPINSVVIKFANNNSYSLSTLEASSEFRIKHITADNDLGGVTPIAVKMEGNLTVIENNYKDFKQFYIDILSQQCTSVWLMLFSEENDSAKIMDINGPPQYGQTPRPTLSLENYSIVPELVIKRPGPQLILTITAFFDLSIINTYYDLLIQQSWS